MISDNDQNEITNQRTLFPEPATQISHELVEKVRQEEHTFPVDP